MTNGSRSPVRKRPSGEGRSGAPPRSSKMKAIAAQPRGKTSTTRARAFPGRPEMLCGAAPPRYSCVLLELRKCPASPSTSNCASNPAPDLPCLSGTLRSEICSCCSAGYFHTPRHHTCADSERSPARLRKPIAYLPSVVPTLGGKQVYQVGRPQRAVARRLIRHRTSHQRQL